MIFYTLIVFIIFCFSTQESVALMQVCSISRRRLMNTIENSKLACLNWSERTKFLNSGNSVTSPNSQNNLTVNSSMCPADAAVAYYAAATVAAAAFSKPLNQSMSDNCMNKCLHQCTPSTMNHQSVNVDQSQHIGGSANINAFSSDKSSSFVDPAYQVSYAYNTMPRSISLYELVTAGGNALSLLSAVADQKSSFLNGNQTSDNRGHFSFNSDYYANLHAQSNHLNSNMHRNATLDAGNTALILNSYLDRNNQCLNNHPIQTNIDLCDPLNAFAQHQSLYNNSIGLATSCQNMNDQGHLNSNVVSMFNADLCRAVQGGMSQFLGVFKDCACNFDCAQQKMASCNAQKKILNLEPHVILSSTVSYF